MESTNAELIQRIEALEKEITDLKTQLKNHKHSEYELKLSGSQRAAIWMNTPIE